MSLLSRLQEVAWALDSIFLGSAVALIRANRKVLKRVSDAVPEDHADDRRLEHEMSVLTLAREDSTFRLQRIEDKAKGTIVGVGIAVTVIGSASAFLAGDGPLATSGGGVRGFVAVLLVAAVGFMLLSGYLALQAYSIGRVFAPTLDDLPPLASSAHAKSVEIYSLEQNQRMGTVRANYVSTSFTCLRNGILLLAVIAVVLVVVSSNSTSKLSTSSVRQTESACDRPSWPEGGRRSGQQWHR
ncbi:MAG: hypothetical protein U1E22_00225 [Coriobacteriia bacterium]|jgi:hypothetical protein|nr:hypothetical protein [Coriobacteriia bacterium]